MPEILQSKKFIAAIIASVLGIVGVYLDIPMQDILVIIAPLGAYTVGQGIADIGKEKAKVEQNGQK